MSFRYQMACCTCILDGPVLYFSDGEAGLGQDGARPTWHVVHIYLEGTMLNISDGMRWAWERMEPVQDAQQMLEGMFYMYILDGTVLYISEGVRWLHDKKEPDPDGILYTYLRWPCVIYFRWREVGERQDGARPR